MAITKREQKAPAKKKLTDIVVKIGWQGKKPKELLAAIASKYPEFSKKLTVLDLKDAVREIRKSAFQDKTSEKKVAKKRAPARKKKLVGSYERDMEIRPDAKSSYFDSKTEGMNVFTELFPCLVVIRHHGEALMFASAAAAYNYFRTVNPKKREIILNCTKPKDISYHTSTKSGFVEREDWEEHRDMVLHEVMLAKFTQNLFLKSRLVQSEGQLVSLQKWKGANMYLSEDDKGNGHNALGKTITDIRDNGLDIEGFALPNLKIS